MRDDSERPNESVGEAVSFPSQDFAAAVALEAQERDFVFASDLHGKPFNREILGVEVVVMTLSQAVNLIHIRSPFLCSGLPTIEDVFRFLWYLSPNFDPNLREQKYPIWKAFLWKFFPNSKLLAPNSRQRLLLQIAFLPLVAWWRGIREHVDQIFTEAPSAGHEPDAGDTDQPDDTGSETPLTSFACDYIDKFGAEYGWTEEYTLSKPLDRLFALMRSMEVRHYARWGKRAPLINYRSDKITAGHLEERNKPELKEERAKKFAHIFAHAPATS